MNVLDPDRIDPTVKLELDEGKVRSYEEADALSQGYRLQLDVGSDLATTPWAQNVLLTVLNSGRRGFKGGVLVRCHGNPVLTMGWAMGRRLDDVIEAYGAVRVSDLGSHLPTIVIGNAIDPRGSIISYPQPTGWSGLALAGPLDHDAVRDSNAVSQALSAALSIAECFQHVRGSVVAGRRSVGFSIWRPDLAWDDPQSQGPPLSFLPRGLWLLGIGHLGQAYAWVLGCLPYNHSNPPCLYLQDFDHVTGRNIATSLMSAHEDDRRLKTRVSADALERLGFNTRLVERAFTSDQALAGDEPDWALAGFHGVLPRRALYQSPFSRVVDVGIGATPSTYLDILVQTLPTQLSADELWPTARQSDHVDQLLSLPAYQDAVARRRATGESEIEARCGVVTVAGQAVGASFVGVAAAALAVGDVLRALHGGARYRVVSLDLRDPRPSYAQPTGESDPTPKYGYLPSAR